MLGVAAAHGSHSSVLVAGVAGPVAGAMSMTTGEYVSVHSQADTELADLKLERAELKADDKGEHRELTAIYVGRGLNPDLAAEEFADRLLAHDALGAHARDELGILKNLMARPTEAAIASAAITPPGSLVVLLSASSLFFLALQASEPRSERRPASCANTGRSWRQLGALTSSACRRACPAPYRPRFVRIRPPSRRRLSPGACRCL